MDGVVTIWSLPLRTSRQMAAYLSMSWPSWTIAMALLCLVLFLGWGGAIRRILLHPVLVILSRLSYTTYLIHPAIICTIYSQMIMPVHFTTLNLIHQYLGFVGMSLVVAFFLHICVS